MRTERTMDLEVENRHLAEEVAELRQIAYGLRSPEIKVDAVQTSPEGDPIGNAVSRYLDVEAEIDAMIDQYVDLKHKIIGEIQELNDPRMVDLLYLRYVKFMRLEEIACTMKKANGDSYNYEYIKRLHGKSLKEFSKCHSKVTFKCDIV